VPRGERQPARAFGPHSLPRRSSAKPSEVWLGVRDDFRNSPAELRALAGWLVERQVDEVVMESIAQYWRPVWEALELHWRPQRRARDGASRLSATLHLAQAQSNRGAVGRNFSRVATWTGLPDDPEFLLYIAD